MDAGRIQLHEALRKQVLRYPPRLGPLLPVPGDDCLLVSRSPSSSQNLEPWRLNAKGDRTRPRGRTKACSATADSGPPPPAPEAKGHRPRALEPLAPMSGPPAHGEPRGRFALTGPSEAPYPASAFSRRCFRRRLPQAPLSPRKPHFRFRTLPSLIGCFSRRSAGWDQ